MERKLAGLEKEINSIDNGSLTIRVKDTFLQDEIFEFLYTRPRKVAL